MEVSFKVEHKATSQAFSRLQLRQYPYALAKALTLTAKDGQSAIRARTRKMFKLHGQYTLRNLRIKPAKKSDVLSRRNAYSEVYTDKRIVPYMPQHEAGHIKTAKEKKLVAVPMRDMKRKRYRTSRGTKSRYLPATLMQERNVFLIKSPTTGALLMVKRKQKPKKTIKPIHSQTKSSKAKIKRNRKPVEFLWALVRRAKIKPTWQFEKTIKRRVVRTFDKRFRQSMQQAMKTAR